MKLSSSTLKRFIDSWITPEIRDKMSRQFDPPAPLDGLTWKRDHKGRIEDEQWKYLNEDAIDLAGEVMGEGTPECWVRIFTPKVKGPDVDGVQEAFRIEVVTDAADEKVVFWSLYVD